MGLISDVVGGIVGGVGDVFSAIGSSGVASPLIQAGAS